MIMNIIKHPIGISFWGNPCMWFVHCMEAVHISKSQYISNIVHCSHQYLIEYYIIMYTYDNYNVDIQFLDFYEPKYG